MTDATPTPLATMRDLADRCARTCKRHRCTGLGHTETWAHRCAFAPPPPPRACSLVIDGRACGADAVARYLTGWRCAEHAPAHGPADWTPPTSPPRPAPSYGTATTDPLGRDGEGWHVGRSGLPTRDA